MEVRGEILILIVLSALVTVVVRVLPLLSAHRLRLSPWAVAWFRLLPPAILAALLLPELLLSDGALIGSLYNSHILAAVLTAIVAFKTRNIMLSIVTGMASYSLLTMVI